MKVTLQEMLSRDGYYVAKVPGVHGVEVPLFVRNGQVFPFVIEREGLSADGWNPKTEFVRLVPELSPECK